MTENEYQRRESELTNIGEGISEEINKLSIKDMVWELRDLKSYSKLEAEVCKLIKDTWRGEGIKNEIDYMLEELLFGCQSNENMEIMISCLDLEQKVKDMMIELKQSQEEYDYDAA